MDLDQGYSGYMPMIGQINISSIVEMINNDGQLVHAHSIIINTRENKEFVFSIEQQNLIRLYFTIHKILSNI